jgi:hypothetical protein
MEALSLVLCARAAERPTGKITVELSARGISISEWVCGRSLEVRAVLPATRGRAISDAERYAGANDDDRINS